MHVIGYGNPGRGDDGLGLAFAARMAARNLPGIVVSSDYQLTVDHALKIANANQVVFVDAMTRADLPFQFASIRPAPIAELSSHSLSPGSVLALASSLYDAEVTAFLLGISGRDFDEVKEGLSAFAKENLALAETFLLGWLGSHKQAAESAIPSPARNPALR